MMEVNGYADGFLTAFRMTNRFEDSRYFSGAADLAVVGACFTSR